MLSLVLLLACGPLPDETDGGTPKPKCTNKIGLAVSVENGTPVATFDPVYFVSSWGWFRMPAGTESETCHQYTKADRVKQGIVDSPDYLAGKIRSGRLAYDELPVPQKDDGYCWRSSNGVRSCYEEGSSDPTKPDPGPALSPGTWELIFYEPGLPTGTETGRARFTLP